jgi:hypothetical protein
MGSTGELCEVTGEPGAGEADTDDPGLRVRMSDTIGSSRDSMGVVVDAGNRADANVSTSLTRSWTYLRIRPPFRANRLSLVYRQTYRSSELTISHNTSCLPLSLGPRLLSKSSSAILDQLAWIGT